MLPVSRLILFRASKNLRSCRPFASTALDRLQAILDKYREENYTQELPSRFIKDVIKVADENKDGMIDVEEVQHLLENIQSQDKLSREEILTIFHEEFGLDATQVPIDVVVQGFLERIRKDKGKTA